jgi:DNA polymerase-3 subunit epsilon
MREILLDTETTGLDPKTGHRIVEIGCVELIHRKRTGATFHSYLNPERDMPQEAYRIHGISGEFLQDKPLFAHVAEDFSAFIEGATLVIHNASFDIKFLNAELKTINRPLLPLDKVIDTLLIARKRFPGSPASLDALCKRFKIDLSSREKHGALLDAELLAEVYIQLMGDTGQTTLSFSAPAQETIAAAPSLTRYTTI